MLTWDWAATSAIRSANLRRATDAIASLASVRLRRSSQVYETPPMGPQDQGAFLNMVLHIETSAEPTALIHALQRIESQLGRAKPSPRHRWGPREIDMDVLLMGEIVMQNDMVTLPHPGIAERWFVLKPMSDLAPDLVHPVSGRSIREMLDALEKPTTLEEVR